MYETEKEIVYEPDDFYDDIEKLAEMLRRENCRPLLSPFDGVYGIPSGGTVLATCLHYRLKLPHLFSPTPNSLVVDDILDSGRTLSHYIKKGMFTVTLFYKDNGLWKPNIWLHEKTDKWIRFLLWEGNEG